MGSVTAANFDKVMEELLLLRSEVAAQKEVKQHHESFGVVMKEMLSQQSTQRSEERQAQQNAQQRHDDLVAQLMQQQLEFRDERREVQAQQEKQQALQQERQDELFARMENKLELSCRVGEQRIRR